MFFAGISSLTHVMARSTSGNIPGDHPEGGVFAYENTDATGGDNPPGDAQ